MSCCKRCRGRVKGAASSQQRAASTTKKNPWMSSRAASEMFWTHPRRRAGMLRPLWGDWPLDDPLSAHHPALHPPPTLHPLHQGSMRCLLVPVRCAHHRAGLSSFANRAPPSFPTSSTQKSASAVNTHLAYSTRCLLQTEFLNPLPPVCPLFSPRTCQIAPRIPAPSDAPPAQHATVDGWSRRVFNLIPPAALHRLLVMGQRPPRLDQSAIA
jgi:hypothetical protein